MFNVVSGKPYDVRLILPLYSDPTSAGPLPARTELFALYNLLNKYQTAQYFFS